MRDQLRTLYRVNKPSGILTMAVYRFGNTVYYHCTIPILRPLLLLLYAILDILVVKLLCGAEFPARCRIGKGLRLPHGSNGIVLHGNAVIGDGVTLFHQVTLGMRDVEEPEAAPHVGSSVIIGAGAKILGRVTVGRDARIGANAVVIGDVPSHSTAVGVPARISSQRDGLKVVALPLLTTDRI